MVVQATHCVFGLGVASETSVYDVPLNLSDEHLVHQFDFPPVPRRPLRLQLSANKKVLMVLGALYNEQSCLLV